VFWLVYPAPADRPKAGSGFDLAIALGILVASGQVPGRALVHARPGKKMGRVRLDVG
jgi:predicted ATPase with chaperone activity